MPTTHHPPLFQPPFHHAETEGGSQHPAPDPHPATHRAGSTGNVTQPRRPGSVTPSETEATRAVPSPPDGTTAAVPSRELLTVEDAAARLAIGRTSMFALLRNRAVESVKVGRLRRVPADAITAYITHLTTEQRPATA